LKNNTAGVREGKEPNRTREAGSRDEVEGVVANTLNLFRHGAAKPRALCFTLVGFIDWLERWGCLARLRLMQTLFDHTLKLTELLFVGSTQNGHLKK
jgi:hypothetical protein